MKDTDASMTESACTSKAISESTYGVTTATETETETTITESRANVIGREVVENMITEKLDSQLKLRVDSNQSKIDEYELMLKVNLSHQFDKNVNAESPK